jgi:ribosome-binding protein aMBF1 (putative translation factor)
MNGECDLCGRETSSKFAVCRSCQDLMRRRNTWNRDEWDERCPMAAAEEETASSDYHGDTDRDDI